MDTSSHPFHFYDIDSVHFCYEMERNVEGNFFFFFLLFIDEEKVVLR